ncbi:AOC03_06830 family ribosome hibernation factor [Lacinutrix salivirga]
MNTILKNIKNLSSENCVTIIMNTHRTKPDSLKDELVLKNLIKETENRLLASLNKKEALVLIEKLKTLATKINHAHNLDSLVLFVNKDIAEFTKLSIPVTDRVIIDNTFSTRDLVRAMHTESNYYILVLSQSEARLIEALNDKVVKEFKAPFPIKNTQFDNINTMEPVVSSRQRNLIAEFFNQVDKEVNTIRNQNPLPVLISTVEENYPEYLKVADQKHSIYPMYLNDNRIAEKDHAIVTEAWKLIEAYYKTINTERKAELLKAVTQNKFLSDTNDIYKAIKEGRIQTLFIEKDLFQPAVIEDDEIIYVSDFQKSDKEVIDDIYDELIELNMDFGGEVVFLPKGELTKFNGFGAITRY